MHPVNPPWAIAPTHSWSLVEIKGGVQVASHPLSKPCIFIGRAADQVDIPLQHESCSREHARIAFDSEGVPWLRDYESTHGTTVNKRRLPLQATGKLESSSKVAGSRGVVLYPGDIIQFGASTRVFCLEGPDSFARGAVKQIIPKSPANPVKQKDFDIEESKSNASIPEIYRKEWENIEVLKRKLENIQEENERIRRKGELTENQLHQVTRNEEQEQILHIEIQNREDRLHRKIYPNQEEGCLSDDEVEDRTYTVATRNEPETEHSLTMKWKDIFNRLGEVENKVNTGEESILQINARLEHLRSKDGEDCFFVENELQLEKETLEKLRQEKISLERDMNETKKLLKVINPKLLIDEVTGQIGVGSVASVVVSKPVSSQTEMRQQLHASGDYNDQEEERKLQDEYRGPQILPPPKRKRITGPVLPQNRHENIFNLQEAPKTKLSVSGLKSIVNIQETIDSSKVDVWQAPLNQDGSGNTRLNEKFGGRY